MSRLGLVILVYVDDCFWVAPKYESEDAPSAEWILRTFEYVTGHLLGWQLDDSKSAVGTAITLLGLDVSMNAQHSTWQLSADKSAQWCSDIASYLESDTLRPSEASKLAGRLAFLNSHVFSRLARALLRPIIWRQVQQAGSYKLTNKLRWSLTWFHHALQSNWTRVIQYQIPMAEDQVLLYTDAESTGHVAAVVIHRQGRWYMAGQLPPHVRGLLLPRKTNIVGYELMAAIMGIHMVEKYGPQQAMVRHFVDSQPALNALVKGSSKRGDLNCLVGSVWYECADKLKSYWGAYVRSKANVADGPSRQEFHCMKQLGARRVPFCVDRLYQAAEVWMYHPSEMAMV